MVDIATLSRSRTGHVTGRVALRFNDGRRDHFFPDVDWSDSPVALLAAWLPMLRATARRESIGAECRFLNGSFAFAVSATDLDFSLQLVDGQASTRFTWTVPASQFMAALQETGRTVLQACDAAGWVNDDIETLRNELT